MCYGQSRHLEERERAIEAEYCLASVCALCERSGQGLVSSCVMNVVELFMTVETRG